jgi:hypothetical protein
MKYPDLAKMTEAEYDEWSDGWWLQENELERRALELDERTAKAELGRQWTAAMQMVDEVAKARGAAGRDRRVIISEVFQRFGSSSVGTCAWCGVDPPRGKTMICQPCNVYRRSNGFPPPTDVIDRRRDRRAGYR